MENNLKLTDPQIYYLRYMYIHKLFPGTETVCSGEIIGRLVRYASSYFYDYTVGQLVEDFYALAQPWMIDTPLIMCKGNIGFAEDIDYEWSGAASPCFTEAVLTDAGVKYVEEHDLISRNFD